VEAVSKLAVNKDVAPVKKPWTAWGSK
jgi:hypothetical protein